MLKDLVRRLWSPSHSHDCWNRSQNFPNSTNHHGQSMKVGKRDRERAYSAEFGSNSFPGLLAAASASGYVGIPRQKCAREQGIPSQPLRSCLPSRSFKDAPREYVASGAAVDPSTDGAAAAAADDGNQADEAAGRVQKASPEQILLEKHNATYHSSTFTSLPLFLRLAAATTNE